MGKWCTVTIIDGEGTLHPRKVTVRHYAPKPVSDRTDLFAPGPFRSADELYSAIGSTSDFG